MTIGKSVIYDGGLQRQVMPGDVVAGGEVIPNTNANTAVTVTGAMLSSGFIQRNPAAAGTDTIDSAANIVAAINSNLGSTSVQPGTTWRCRWILTTANAITVQASANTGVTVTRGTVNASSVKEFLITVVNGTPAQAAYGTTVNGSAVISNVSAAVLANVTVGMVVTNAVANLQGTTVLAVNLNAGTITLSGNANADNTAPVLINLSPVITVVGIGQGLL